MNCLEVVGLLAMGAIALVISVLVSAQRDEPR